MAFGNQTSGLTLLFIVIFTVALLYFFVFRNPKFQALVNKLFSGIAVPAAGEETTPPPSGDTSGIDPSPTCPSGEECVEDNGGTRMECDESKPDAYEATWCGSFSGDQMTVKMYGPPHSSDGDCCWCNGIVHEDGTFAVGGEGPHPSSNCEHQTGESLGGTSDICMKWVIEPGPKWTGYGLVDGAWKEMITYEGTCGCDETSSEKTGDQLAFRCDGSLDTTCATVKPYGGGGGGGGTTPPPANGNGGTTPPPSGGEDGEEEEEEEPEEEEEEEEEEDEDEDEDESGNLARIRAFRGIRRGKVREGSSKVRGQSMYSKDPFYREFGFNARSLKMSNFR
jgi:hypothetical protein